MPEWGFIIARGIFQNRPLLQGFDGIVEAPLTRGNLTRHHPFGNLG